MARLPLFDPIEHLVQRKFPHSEALMFPPDTGCGGMSHEERVKLSEEVQAYVIELKGLPPGELDARVKGEHAKQVASARVRAELEEKALFFHQQYAAADFVY